MSAFWGHIPPRKRLSFSITKDTSNGRPTSHRIRGRILDENEMAFLRDTIYIYNAFNGSYLERLFLQRFWIKLSGMVPDWIAPCVLTCTGITINVVTCLILLYYSPSTGGNAPPWAFVLAAIGVFCYQTLDGIDGKVAIANQNTQIEEVYDHGCDAISTIFVTLEIAVAFQLGRYPMLNVLCLLVPSIAFFSTHWLCHIKHQMVFGRVDVAEAQFLMMAIHLLTAYFGQSMWHIHLVSVRGFQLALVHIMVLGIIFGLLLAIFHNVNLAVLGAKTPLEKLGVRIPARRGLRIWYPLVPIAALTVLAIWAFYFGYFVVSPTTFYITFGLAYTKVTIKLLMKNISHGTMELTDTALLPPLFIALNTLLSLMLPTTALTWSLFLTAIDLGCYFSCASWDLQDALGLNIFSIKYPPGHPRSRNGPCGLYFHGLNKEDILRNPRANLPRGYNGDITFDFE
ncbi:hypothetical protein BDV33DRAFT_198955 [Aspergillus novoparasiticus]|uniref:CDP-alcohol phosphatidyltransferase-domain-containing protein n=1 Tax=Aspergillus novoparasiticus TaxID=986946 RepID=A0A5N6F5I8_9EURO|nr:hypothetical protein BDV33DRAFT_198955 [Aspergillus novoparasiticus]